MSHAQKLRELATCPHTDEITLITKYYPNTKPPRIFSNKVIVLATNMLDTIADLYCHPDHKEIHVRFIDHSNELVLIDYKTTSDVALLALTDFINMVKSDPL